MLWFLVFQVRSVFTVCDILFAERGVILSRIPGVFFQFFCISFRTNKDSTVRFLISTTIYYESAFKKSTMRLPVVIIMKEVKELKRRKIKIGVDFVVSAKFGSMEDNIRGRVIRRIKKEFVVFSRMWCGIISVFLNFNVVRWDIGVFFVFMFWRGFWTRVKWDYLYPTKRIMWIV